MASAVNAQGSIRSGGGAYLLDSYVAYISEDDLYNSNGERLREPWQIIRQDRANVHRFGIVDADDTFDSFFDSQANRNQLEKMLRNGSIERQAARDIVRGGASVLVEIYGRGDTGTAVYVSVYR
ncbi:hypothetical protein JI748_02325 [Devosia rhizoryzae]|uniref:Uncharacterized protein n=2 Tax=Devosia rhizoryzae TaxID=2774137 RepID=A0ABX7CAE2_9HYPH|nr:hypothetical protein JI748_02325 [Devosia rhizoryzae]